MSFMSNTCCGVLTTGVVAGLLWAAPVAAQESNPGADEAPQVFVAGRVGAGVGLNLGGFFARLEAGYRLAPSLVVGASIETPIAANLSDGDFCADAGVGCVTRYFLGGVRAEFQPWADSVVAPWVGAEIGGIALIGYNAKPALPALSADAGIEVRPIRSLGIGAYVSTTFLTTDPYIYDPYPENRDGLHLELGSVGLRVAGRFDVTSE